MLHESLLAGAERTSAITATAAGRLQRVSSDEFAGRLAEASERSGLNAAPATRIGVSRLPGLPAQTASQTNSTRQISAAPEAQTSQTQNQDGWYGLIEDGRISQAAAAPAPVASAPSSATSPASQSSGANTADDDYWASQPAAVQQLRSIQDPNQREQVANQLAHEGYQIDVPIMVWGWDPVATMQMRESYGYTWVPALGQQPLEEVPGINVPGLAEYNPAAPPPGSISVSVPT